MKKITLKFDEKALNEAKELFENVKITAHQQDIIHTLATKMVECRNDLFIDVWF